MPKRELTSHSGGSPGDLTTDDTPRVLWQDDYPEKGPGWVLYYIDDSDDVASRFIGSGGGPEDSPEEGCERDFLETVEQMTAARCARS